MRWVGVQTKVSSAGNHKVINDSLLPVDPNLIFENYADGDCFDSHRLISLVST